VQTIFIGIHLCDPLRTSLHSYMFVLLSIAKCAEREATQRIRKGGSWSTTIIHFIVSMATYAFTIDAVYGILLCVVCSFSGQRGTIGCRHSLGEIFVWVAKVELQAF
jgi:hypothetical protein